MGSVQRGSRAVKRVAIVRESGNVNGWSGSVRINESNLRVAASADIAARLAASCQGSRSRRASSDTTLSGMPLRSSPIGENRKALNSEPRRGAGSGVFILFAKSSSGPTLSDSFESSSVRLRTHVVPSDSMRAWWESKHGAAFRLTRVELFRAASPRARDEGPPGCRRVPGGLRMGLHAFSRGVQRRAPGSRIRVIRLPPYREAAAIGADFVCAT